MRNAIRAVVICALSAALAGCEAPATDPDAPPAAASGGVPQPSPAAAPPADGTPGAAEPNVDSYARWVQEQNIPAAIRRHFEPEDTTGRFEVIFELNPFYLRGDFNGDGAPDLAVLVRERASDKRGIAILHGGAAEPVIIGAGTPFRDGDDDFRWMGVWKVFPQDLALLDEGMDLPADAAAREGLFVEKPESASGVIYWNGQRYVWSQMGD